MPDAEWNTYTLDQTINDTGILLDPTLVDNAVAMDKHHRNATLTRAQKLTGLENPNSPIQLKDWLASKGCAMTSLTKEEVATALENATGDVREALELRCELSKSSVKKYEAMQNVAGTDGRARGLIQFYGAGRTGRFAGRLVQVQNLPRNYLPDLDQARSLVRAGDLDALELLYDSVPDTLSQLIRTAFIPSPGHRFIVADFSAIEARVIAWLAGERATLAAFREGKDLYCETAARMFGVPVEKHGINGELRQKGKIAVLACGYGGSVGALKAMGALTMRLAEHELKPIVDAWRQANPHIVRLWADVEQAAIAAITSRQPIRLRNLRFSVESGILAKHYTAGRGGRKIDKIIIHHNAGNLTIPGIWDVWQTRPASAHYQVDSAGRIGQLVWDRNTAWHEGNWDANTTSIGIEHADISSNPWRISDACLEEDAHLTAAVCKYYGLGRPQWGKNVYGHKHFSPTECPASLAGTQHAAYMARAQYWYDQMTGKAPAPKLKAPTAPAPKPAPSVNIDALADAVIRGEYGNGEERKRRLGANYAAVQKRVNEKLAGNTSKPSVNIDALADVVIRGEYGNGDKRKRRLGANYAAVQKRVNQKLGY